MSRGSRSKPVVASEPGATATSDAIKSCKRCKRWKEIKQRMRVAEFIEKTVKNVEDKLNAGAVSPTLAEYLKLLQLEQEWEQQDSIADGPKEITVTWVGAEATSNEEK